MTVCDKCGGPARHRSDEAHGLLFAAITAAFSQWPHKHRFQPESPEHLRAWLLVEAGHVDFVDVDLTTYDVPTELAEKLAVSTVKAARSLLSDKIKPRVYRTLDGIRLVAPRSIDYKTLGKREFQDVAQRVYEVIELELKVDPVKLVKETERAA